MTTPISGLELSTYRRLQSIDVIRGVSVVLVVLHHINLRFRLNHYDVATLLPHSVGQVLFWSGYYSVVTFFVISGFLITSLSLRRWGTLDRMSLSEFYRFRVARILPCLLLLLVVLSALHLLGYSDFVIKSDRASLTRALVAALTLHVNWLEGARGYLPGNWDVLWSLSVEEAFYLLFPLLCLVLRRERWVLFGMLSLIVVGPLNRTALAGHEPWNDYAYLSCMDGIAFGFVAALISARAKIGRRELRIAMITGVGEIVLVVMLRTQTFDVGLTRTGLSVTILELGVALVLLALANGVGDHTLSKGTRLFQLAGRSSYEIYLTHMFVVLGLMHPFKALFGTSPRRAVYLLTYAIMLFLSVVLGRAVSCWYSEPLNHKLRRRSGVGATPIGVNR